MATAALRAASERTLWTTTLREEPGCTTACGCVGANHTKRCTSVGSADLRKAPSDSRSRELEKAAGGRGGDTLAAPSGPATRPAHHPWRTAPAPSYRSHSCLQAS